MDITTAGTASAPVAVITGASRGLGLELARALARDGWRLVITARSAADLAVVEAELAAVTEVAALAGSVVDDDHRERLAAAAEKLGGAALLVNNAGTLTGYDLAGAPMPALADFPLPGLLETFEVNVLGPIALTQLLLPQLRHHGGSIVNLSSDAAREAYVGWSGYGASKAALDHASAVLALEEPEVRVWVVEPGDMRTDMYQEAFPGEDISDRPLPADTAVPGILALIARHPASGRYLAETLTGSH
ncbi:NAD(P)-dependent dehydrogenase (short-subunit alcohol dehydrogenase family) [Kitasatospora gansuensis]|uniref:NAD(P)-dependent dehydrogenase (Short-subunit alcohol dehydrogenase family) n=1 Tax=Kitasatospora gansuensis TaxID=258050 RepID=A0A7W7S781_9ACTN|nr:SDR family oxidoreductase [Kitasatospora gansuensis]MBB4945201.1 NAD(P)-dependent dehydrogenase (short-subunit alcohol dehydrogenase family) [Kitasatospora gansuensis]